MQLLLKERSCLSWDSQSAVHIEQCYSLVTPVLCCSRHFMFLPHCLAKQFFADPTLSLYEVCMSLVLDLCSGVLRYTTWWLTSVSL